MINSGVNSYGFPFVEVITAAGGHLTVTNYGGIGPDLGSYTSMNPHGMGSSSYVRHEGRGRETIDFYLLQLPDYVWLTADEKAAIAAFLERMRTERFALCNCGCLGHLHRNDPCGMVHMRSEVGNWTAYIIPGHEQAFRNYYGFGTRKPDVKIQPGIVSFNP